MNLKPVFKVYLLYIRKSTDRFIGYFKTYDEAMQFAKKHYGNNNVEAWIEPADVWSTK